MSKELAYLEQPPFCHSDPASAGEESQIIGPNAVPEESQRCLKAWPHASHFVAALRST
jgi:hypothetical protein